MHLRPMKALAAASIAAVVLAAACSDSPTSLTPNASAPSLVSSTSVPTGNGPVWVKALSTFEITYTTVGGSFGVGQNTHPQNKGICAKDGGPRSSPMVSETTTDNTTWYNEANNWTNAPFCRGHEGTSTTKTVTCKLSDLQATYAYGGSGQQAINNTSNNELLNALTDDYTVPADNSIQYNGQKKQTVGKGSATVGYACTDERGADDLAGIAVIQLGVLQQGNAFMAYYDADGTHQVGRKLNLTFSFPTPDAVSGTTSKQLDFAWIFRSRNGIPMSTQL